MVLATLQIGSLAVNLDIIAQVDQQDASISEIGTMDNNLDHFSLPGTVDVPSSSNGRKANHLIWRGGSVHMHSSRSIATRRQFVVMATLRIWIQERMEQFMWALLYSCKESKFHQRCLQQGGCCTLQGTKGDWVAEQAYQVFKDESVVNIVIALVSVAKAEAEEPGEGLLNICFFTSFDDRLRGRGPRLRCSTPWIRSQGNLGGPRRLSQAPLPWRMTSATHHRAKEDYHWSVSSLIGKESLLAAQKEDLRKVMEHLALSKQHARTLLIHYR